MLFLSLYFSYMITHKELSSSFCPLLLPRGGDLWEKRRFFTIKLLELTGCIIPLGIFS